MTEDLHHVQSVIDEMGDSDCTANRLLFGSLEAEPQLIAAETGSRVEVDSVQPIPGDALGSWSRFRDDPDRPGCVRHHIAHRIEYTLRGKLDVFASLKVSLLAPRAVAWLHDDTTEIKADFHAHCFVSHST